MSQIHKTAIIESGAIIGKDVEIGPYCVIGSNVKLGDGVVLKSHVVVEGRTTIGSGTVIYPFASLGHIPQDLKYAGEEAELIIGSNNIIREHVTMNIGTADLMRTVVGDNCLFMMSSHVAHDCVVGNNVILANNATLAGHVRLGNFVILGGLSAVHQFVNIGDYVMIGGLSGVNRHVTPYSMVLPEYPSLGGLNIVGLKRKGFSQEDIKNIKKAYDILFDDSRTLVESISQLEETFGNDESVSRIIDFLKHENSRGFLTPRIIMVKFSRSDVVAVIAGGGDGPKMVIESLRKQKVNHVVAAINDNTNPSLLEEDVVYKWFGLGEVQKLLKFFHDNNVSKVVFIGSIARPSFSSLKLDMYGFLLAFRYGLGCLAGGDDKLLSSLIKMFEDKGYVVISSESITPELIAPSGVLGKIKPNKSDIQDIEMGMKILGALGDLDVGQSVIVERKYVLGIEAAEGTDNLIKRCKTLKKDKKSWEF